MSKIKVEDLWVKVTYEVRLGDLKMPKKAFEETIEAAENGDTIDMSSMDYRESYDWLSNHIKESDCIEWEAEIIDITPDDGE